MIVADASAILDVLLRTEAAASVETRIFSGETLHAPHVLDLEIAQVLRRYEQRMELSARRGAEALADYADLTIERYPHYFFLGRIWELRHNVTAYDAAYLALAEAIDAPLITRDARLARAPGHLAKVEVIE